jgi:outer membrane protein assembly factor BamB
VILLSELHKAITGDFFLSIAGIFLARSRKADTRAIPMTANSHRAFISSLVVAGLWSAVLPINGQVNVTQEHNNLSRDGLYIDSAFTPSAAANVTRDLNFSGTISGNVYAQPLYIENGPGGAAMVIVVTESNNVYALDAADGTVIWQRNNIGTPVSSGLPCGNISPLGITGTPVVDLKSRSLFFDAMIDGATKKHFIYSLNVDTGATNPNWPVDVNATATYNGTTWQIGVGGSQALAGRSIRFRPGDSQELFLGTSSLAVFRSTNGGDTFVESSQGISELDLFAIDANPLDPARGCRHSSPASLRRQLPTAAGERQGELRHRVGDRADPNANTNSHAYTYPNGDAYAYPDAWRDHAQCARAQGAGQAHDRSHLERVECGQYRHLP